MQLRFRPTPKSPTGQINFFWIAPQMFSFLALVAGTTHLLVEDGMKSIVLAAFAFLLAVAQLPVLFLWVFPEHEHPVRVTTAYLK
jgi:hypothetical protein